MTRLLLVRHGQTPSNVLGLLDNPSGGSYDFFGEEVARASEKRLTQLRRERIGFVFQSFNLIDDLTVAENVEVALIYRGVSARDRRQRVEEALEHVGISHRARHRWSSPSTPPSTRSTTCRGRPRRTPPWVMS